MLAGRENITVPRLKLHWWILIGMFVGAAIGALLHGLYPTDVVQNTALYHAVDGIATIFLNLLKLIVIPLVFFSLITGMLGMGSLYLL